MNSKLVLSTVAVGCFSLLSIVCFAADPQVDQAGHAATPKDRDVAAKNGAPEKPSEFEKLEVFREPKAGIQYTMSGSQRKSKQVHFIYLLTVKFFSGKKMLGVYQVFGESWSSPGDEGTSLISVDNMPDDATSANVSMQTCDFPLSGQESKWRDEWYSFSWGHFTTARRTRDGYKFIVTDDAAPANLSRWFKESGFPFDGAQIFEGTVPVPAAKKR